MRRMTLCNVAALLAVVGPPACTGVSSFPLPVSDAGAPDSRNEGVCTAWAKTDCAFRDRCPPRITTRWETDAQCLARETLQCELEAADPDVNFDPVAVAGCASPADCQSLAPGLRRCLPPGKAAAGAPCQWNEACVNGTCLLPPPDEPAGCGVCVTPRRCSITCDGGETCEFDVDGGERCVTLPTVPLASVGEACGADAGGPVCFDPNVEVYCDETQHCRAFQPANYGQSCADTDAGAAYWCEGFGTCALLDTYLCVAPAADGALCDDRQGLSCLPPARCQANHCTFPNLSWCSH